MTPRFQYQGAHPLPAREVASHLVGTGTEHPAAMPAGAAWRLYWKPRAWTISGTVTIQTETEEGETASADFALQSTSPDRARECYVLGIPTLTEHNTGGPLTEDDITSVLSVTFKHYPTAVRRPDGNVYPKLEILVTGTQEGSTGTSGGLSGPGDVDGAAEYTSAEKVPGKLRKELWVHLHIPGRIAPSRIQMYRTSGNSLIFGDIILEPELWEFPRG